MIITRGWMRYIFLALIVVLMLIYPIDVHSEANRTSIGNEALISKIPTSENTLNDNDILILCEENNLSSNLVLAIFYTEGIHPEQTDALKTEIEKLVYLRDYWATQGIPDEIVSDLMLLSRQRRIEGCLSYIKDNDSYQLDSYIQQVTEYKYYLDQKLDV